MNIHMANDRPANPVIVSRGRPWQDDLSIPVLQQARDGGIALRKSHLLTENAAKGEDASNPTLLLIEAIKKNTDIELALRILKLGFIGRVVNLTPGEQAQLIPKSKFPRGYIIINPSEIAGFTTSITPFASAARAPATVNSANFNVSGVDTARFFLDITANALPHTLTVALQTQDPLTLNFATAQADIFAGANTVGTFYASTGPVGIDRIMRLQAVIGAGAGTMTFSISGLLKGSAVTPTGSTIYIGPPDVNATSGYPILPGQREYFWLWDDVEVFAISPTEPLQIKVFQLQ